MTEEQTGTCKPRTISLKNSSVIIGRASSRDSDRVAKNTNLFLRNSHLSKSHARISFSGKQAFIEDTSSTFGTVWNNQLLIPRKQAALSVGDWVGFVLNRPSASIQTLVTKSAHLKMIPLLSFLNPRVQVKFRITAFDFEGETLTLVPLSGFESSSDREGSAESANVTTHNSSQAESEDLEDSDSAPEEVPFNKESSRSNIEREDIEPERYTIDTTGGSTDYQVFSTKTSVQSDEAEEEQTEAMEHGSESSDDSAGSESDSEVDSDSSKSRNYSSSVPAEAASNDGSESSFLADLLEENCSEDEADSDEVCSFSSSSIRSKSEEAVDQFKVDSDESDGDELSFPNEVDVPAKDFSAFTKCGIASLLISADKDSEVIEDTEVTEDMDSTMDSIGSTETTETTAIETSITEITTKQVMETPNEKAIGATAEIAPETSTGAECSRKRKHEEEDYTVKRRRRGRLNTFVREASRGMVYVVGTLAALVAYGGYLENRG